MKINYDRPKVKSASINQKKNFEQLKQMHTSSTLPFYKNGWFIAASFSLVIMLFGIVLLNKSKKKFIEVKETKSLALFTDSTLETKKVNYLEDTPCINPPSSHLIIPFENYKVDPTKKQIIKLKNASISIPAFSFVDENQKQLKDSVLLKFRVFNDPIDFVFSGIPMEYDSAGKIFTFESSGMFELQGNTINDKSIFINKNHPLTITFEVPEGTPDFNFYKLDTINKAWNYLSSNNLTKEIIPIEIPKTHNFDTPEYKTLYREQNIANQKWENAKKEIIKHKKVKPVGPDKLKDKSKTFTLDIDKKQFPELSSFTKLNFAPINSTKDLSKIYNTEWSSIKLKEYQKGVSYQIILQNETSIESLIAQPVYEGTDWAEAQLLYSNKFSEYIDVLSQKVEKSENLKENYLKKKQLFDDRDKLKAKVKNTIKTVSVTLTAPVISLGIFNFDKPILSRPKNKTKDPILTSPKNNLEIKMIEEPHFSKNNGKPIQFEKIYVIESKRNATFTYDLVKNNYFSYNQNSHITIIGFNEDQNLILIDKANFNTAIKNNKKFIGKEMPNISIAELKKLVLEI